MFNDLTTGEQILIFGTIITMIVLLLVLLLQQYRIKKLVLNKGLYLSDEIYQTEIGENSLKINYTNKSYVNFMIAEVGFIYEKKYYPIEHYFEMINARSFEQIEFEVTQLRLILLLKSKRVKKIRIYVRDSVGTTSVRKAKDLSKYLRKLVKKENKDLRISQKQLRMKTGNYNFGDRTIMILAIIFSPFKHLRNKINRSINQSLKKRNDQKSESIMIETQIEISDNSDEVFNEDFAKTKINQVLSEHDDVESNDETDDNTSDEVDLLADENEENHGWFGAQPTKIYDSIDPDDVENDEESKTETYDTVDPDDVDFDDEEDADFYDSLQKLRSNSYDLTDLEADKNEDEDIDF